MKKILSILAAVGLTATASTAVVACTATAKVSNGKASETYKNVKLAKNVKQSDVTKDDFKVTVKNGSDDVTSKVTSTVEVSNGKKSNEVTIKVTVDASSLALAKKTTLKVEITTANDASAKKFDKKFDNKFDMKMPKQAGVAIETVTAGDISKPGVIDGAAVDAGVNKGNGYYQMQREVALKISKVNTSGAATGDNLLDSSKWNADQIKVGNDALLSVYSDGDVTSIGIADVLGDMQTSNGTKKTLSVRMITLGQLIDALNNSSESGASSLKNKKSNDFIEIVKSSAKEGYPYQIRNTGSINAEGLHTSVLAKDAWTSLYNAGKYQVNINFAK